jgi:vacuolar-type H+-ATPase subunit H
MMQNIQNPIDEKENRISESSSSGAEDAHKRIKDPKTNEEFIQKVIEIEKDADKIHDKAVHEAEQLPVRADQEAQGMIDKSRAAAQLEAARLVDQAKVQEDSAKILAEAEKNVQHTEMLASSNLNRAVAYVIARVIGRE